MTSKDEAPPTPLFVGITEAARMIGLGRSKTWELVASGDIFSVREGTRRLIPMSALNEWAQRKITEAGGDY